MRAHLIQLDIVWHDKQANYNKVERLVSRADPDEGEVLLASEIVAPANASGTVTLGARAKWLVGNRG